MKRLVMEIEQAISKHVGVDLDEYQDDYKVEECAREMILALDELVERLKVLKGESEDK